MKAYFAIFKCRLAALFQYRAAALAGLTTQFFWGWIKMTVLTAFYAHTAAAQPISLAEAITFVWLSQSLLQLVPWTIDKEVEAQIKSGNVAYELVRPVEIYWNWFYRAIAMRVVPTALRCLPIFILAGLFFGLSAPVSWYAGILFCISLIFSVLLSSAITTLILTSLFWTISGEGIQRMLPATAIFLAGVMVPLPLFPDWMQPFMSLQPFRGVVDIPIRLYTGIIPAVEAPFYFAFQIGWAAFLILLGIWLSRRATKHIIIQGG